MSCGYRNYCQESFMKREMQTLMRRLIQLAAVSGFLLFSGCDFLNSLRAEKKAPAEKAPAEKAGDIPAPEKKEAAERKDITLTAGQTQEEVVGLLGKPSGTMSSGNKVTLVYNGVLLSFENGILQDSVTNVFERIEAKKDTEKKTAVQKKPASKTAGDWLRNKTASTGLFKGLVLNDKQGKPIDHSSLTTMGYITVVDFYATWCGPCRRVSPILEKIAAENGDVVLRKVDIGDWGSPVTTRYNVNSVPNIRVFDRQGRLVARPTSNPDEVLRYIQKARKSE